MPERKLENRDFITIKLLLDLKCSFGDKYLKVLFKGRLCFTVVACAFPNRRLKIIRTSRW